jgi:uracil-DNA glycosylase family 4
MQKLEKEIEICRKCPLWASRNKPLVGDGLISSKYVFIGEAPGYHEDIQGKAFVGKAGKILDQLLQLVNLSRREIYFTNVLKCHPPQNRNPLPEEIRACIWYLFYQLKIIKPEKIVTLGKFAAETLFRACHLAFTKISDIHGRAYPIQASYGKVDLIALYHPSTACYNSAMFDVLREDILKNF